MLTVETEVANKPANIANDDIMGLLAELASDLADEMSVSKETGVANILKMTRWYQNKAGAIVIVKRGSDRKVLATISPKSGKWTNLYPSWERVLANLEAKKQAANTSRASHDDLEPGALPVLAESDK